MRRPLIGVVLLMATLGPAQADTVHEQEVSFHAAPCSVVCEYLFWGAPDGYDPCRNPFPAVTYDDETVTAPNGANLMVLRISPALDWDPFICEVGDTANHNGIPDEMLASRSNSHPSPCDPPAGLSDDLGLGCSETASVPVVPGTQYTLRAYNWLDVEDCPGLVRFMHVG